MVLSVAGLSIAVGHGPARAEILRDVSLSLERGQVLGLVGESGSGKTTLVRALAGFLPRGAQTGGTVAVDGSRVLGPGAVPPTAYRGKRVSMIQQDPQQALNPSMRVGDQIAEAIRNATGARPRTARTAARELLALVRISDPAGRARQYPYELSGGMRQRVAIAIAMACRPALLLADEPTTALDVTTQLQILRLLDDLRREVGMAVVFVSHDLALVRLVSDRIAVLYAGTVVEAGPAATVLDRPRMPYTDALVACSLDVGKGRGRPLDVIDGEPPSAARRPPGCAFSVRCRAARAECAEHEPPPVPLDDVTSVRCWYPVDQPAARMRVGPS